MIELTDLKGRKFLVNQNLVKKIESAPDSVLFFTDGTNIVVKETPADIQNKIVNFLRRIEKIDIEVK